MAARAERVHAELLNEPLEELPTELAVPDFERWALKLALHVVRMVESAGETDQLLKPLRQPEILALDIKQRIIGKLSDGYVVSERNPGLFGPDYSYCFRQPIPSQVILEAAVAAGILERPGT